MTRRVEASARSPPRLAALLGARQAGALTRRSAARPGIDESAGSTWNLQRTVWGRTYRTRLAAATVLTPVRDRTTANEAGERRPNGEGADAARTAPRQITAGLAVRTAQRLLGR